MSIAEFLSACITEDEAAAREAPEHAILGEVTRYSVDAAPPFFLLTTREVVLAECAAKRARIGLHTVDHRGGDRVCYRCMVDCDVQWGSSVAQYEDWPCTPLRLEAAPYKDHPDFDPSWS